MVVKFTEKIVDLEDCNNGDQASADLAGSATPITDQSEIQKRLQEKIEEVKFEKRKTSSQHSEW